MSNMLAHDLSPTCPSMLLRPVEFRPCGSSIGIGARWLDLLCIVLMGYALFGKGWAYMGVSPVFIGELTLMLGFAAMAATSGWGRAMAQSMPLCFVVLLMGWGLVRTLPYVGVYGIDALRDAVLWGYGAYAVLAFALLVSEPTRLPIMIDRYRTFAKVFLVVGPVIWMGTRVAEHAVPNWPWIDVPIVHAKGGDLLTHMAGILAFWIAGLGNAGGWVVVLSMDVLAIGAYSRAGLIAFAAVFAVCFGTRPRSQPLARIAGTAVIVIVVLAVTGVGVQLSSSDKARGERQVSFDQLADNLLSFASQEEEELGNTKGWRLNWWSDIVDYTLAGPYFWTGKGFGVNLADDDGYQGTRWQGELRSPHNGHLCMLARAGVPGLALWILVQAAWILAVFRRYSLAKRAGQAEWAGLFLFLMAYWLAFIINALFDVFLEGPMGGVWFWSIYGIGLAAVRIHQTHPEALMRGNQSASCTRRYTVHQR